MRTSLNILDDFPATAHGDWLAAVDKQLKGKPFEKALVKKTYEGIPVQPMYFKKDLEALPHVDTLPGFAPYVRGNRAAGNRNRPWRAAQEIRIPDPEDLNAALTKELARGQDTVNIILDRAGRAGRIPDSAGQGNDRGAGVGDGGVSLATVRDMDRLLAGIDIDTLPLMAKAGMSAPAVAALAAASLRGALHESGRLSGCIGMDPLGVLASEGQMDMEQDTAWDAMADLCQWARANCPGLKTLLVDVSAYANAGANAVQEVAFAAATAVAYIRALQERGVDAAAVFPGFQFSFAIGSDFFMEIAKFRAARLVWQNIGRAFSLDPEDCRMAIHGRTGLYNKTRIDPWVNMLRVSTETFSGIAGGCDSLHVGPFDEALGLPNEFSRRIARNVHTVFKEEAHFDKVADPAGGSWYVENITLALAEKAWQLFQEIEGEGGMAQALAGGTIQDRVEAVAAARSKNAATRKDTIVGVSMYPNLGEKTIEKEEANGPEWRDARRRQVSEDRTEGDADAVNSALETLKAAMGPEMMDAAVEAARAGADLSQLCHAMGRGSGRVRIRPLKIHRRAEPFEALRLKVQTFKEETGKPVGVFMANIGPLARHKPRADFSTAFFNVAAVDTVSNNGFDSPEAAADAALASKAGAVVICGTDDDYEAFVPDFTARLKAADPGILVIVAGFSKAYVDAFKAAGVDEFIHLRADALAVLTILAGHLMNGRKD